MKVNDIIVLENKQRFYLLNETTLDNNEFFMAAEVDNKGNVDKKKLAFFKKIYEKDNYYVMRISDDTIIYRLSEIFADA